MSNLVAESGATIRLPRWDDLPQCRALLPNAFPAAGFAPELLVAVEAGRIAGAAAVAWTQGGFPITLHVVPGCRRRGLGRALLRASIDSVRGETGLLRSWGPVPEASGLARLLLGAGFQVTRRLLVFDTDGTAFEPATLASLDRILAKAGDGLPVPLRQAPRDGVAALVMPYFAMLPQDIGELLSAGTPDGYDLDLSPVLLRRGGVAGAMLCRRLGQVLQIDLHVVAPEWRRGTAGMLLFAAVTRAAREAGLERVRFFCDPSVRDTVNLGRRTGAVSLPAMAVLTRTMP